MNVTVDIFHILFLCIACFPVASASEGIPPYWSRESALHEDVISGSVVGNPWPGIQYNPQLPPRSHDTERPEVRVGLNVYKIKDINIATSRMELNMWLRMSWTDPRLAWDPSEPRYLNITQTTYNADVDPEIAEIWVPDLELVNQDDPLVDSFAHKQAQVYPDGSVFWSRVGSINALCAFSGLKKHPFDKNECTLDFSGWSRSGLFANYMFMDPPLSWTGTGTAANTYQEYRLVPEEFRASVEVYFYPCCPDEPWPTLTYTFVFERITTWLYLRTLSLPVIFLTFLASAVFWWDIRCGERLGYGITVLLAITAVEIIAEESLPTCPEWLWIEAITAGSFLFSVACLVESAVVTHIYYKQREEDLSEWMKTGEDKKNEEDDDRSVHSCDGGGSPSDSSEKKMENIEEEDPRSSLSRSLSRRVRKRFSSLTKKRKNKAEDIANFNRWTAERNLDPDAFASVLRIDTMAFRIFMITYCLFLFLMCASLPLWRDEYQVDH